MMKDKKVIAFLQASVSVPNIHGRPSLILENYSAELENGSLLEHLLQSITRCKNIDSICIITSSNECDDPIEEIAIKKNNKLKDSVSNVKSIQCIRIPNESPYSFKIQKSIIDNNFTYANRLHGIFSMEGILSCCEIYKRDAILVMDADTSVLIDPCFLDDCINNYFEEMVFVGFLNPRRGVAVFNMEQYKRYAAMAKNRKDKSIKARKDRINESARKLTGVWDSDKIKKTGRIRSTRISAESSLTPYCFPINIYQEKEVKKREVSEFLSGKEYMFHPFTRMVELKLVEDQDFDTISDWKLFLKEVILERRKQYPGYLEIEPTSNCNYNCSFCPHRHLKRKSGFLEVDRFKSIIDESADYISFLNLSGYGEPLLHPEITQMIGYTKKKNVNRVCLETGGDGLTVEKVKGLIDVGLDIIVINMNACCEAKLDVDELIFGIVEIKEQSKRNFHLILKIINTSEMEANMPLIFSKWEDVVDRIIIVPYEVFGRIINDEQTMNFSPLKRSFCVKLRNSMFIAWNGGVHKCQLDPIGNSVIGNANEASIAAIWNSSEYEKLRLSHMKQDYDDKCKYCRSWYVKDPLSEKNLQTIESIEKWLWERHSSSYLHVVDKTYKRFSESLIKENIPQIIKNAKELIENPSEFGKDVFAELKKRPKILNDPFFKRFFLGHSGFMATGEIKNARCMAIDREGYIYFADMGERERIHKYSIIGEKQFSFGIKGEANGNIKWVAAMDVFPNDRSIFVSDSLNRCIYRYTEKGEYLQCLKPEKDGDIFYPGGICIVDETLYVIDQGRNCLYSVNITDRDFNWETEYIASSDVTLYSICSGLKSRLYLMDSRKNIILERKSKEDAFKVIYTGIHNEVFYCLDVDAENRIIICDPNSMKLYLLDTNDVEKKLIEIQGPFKSPIDVKINNNQLYVLDEDRVHILEKIN